MNADIRQGEGAVTRFLPGLAVALTLLSGTAAASDAAPSPSAKPSLSPTAIPGFQDPATGRFTPLSVEPSTAGKEVSGTFNVAVHFVFDSDFSQDDTIFCTITLVFGNHVANQFFTNHTAANSVNFNAEPDHTFSVPYAYTPNSKNAKVRLEIECRGLSDSGTEHTFEDIYPVQDLPDGNVRRDVTEHF